MPPVLTSPPQGALAVALPDVPLVEISYHRRHPAEKAALRESFQLGDRQAFLRHLLVNHEDDLRARGFTQRNLESLSRGKVPHGYNVHHIRPLDDGGDNRFENLVLLRAHPEHEAIHRYLDPQLRDLPVGQSRQVSLPYPPPGAYRKADGLNRDRALLALMQRQQGGLAR